MNTKEVLETVKKAVLDVKQQKQDVISVDAMTHYLETLIIDTEGQESETSLAAFHAEHNAKIEEYKADQLHDTEMFRSVINFAGSALKSAMLINGGAAVALMAFIGNIWTKVTAVAAVTSLTNSVFYFAFGVLAAALATMMSYFTQYFYHHGPEKLGVAFHVVSTITGIGSFVLFGWGAFEVYTAFVQHLGSQILIPPSGD